MKQRFLKWFNNNFFVRGCGLVGVVLYMVDEYREIGWLGYVSILFFVPSFIFLYRLIYRGLGEKARFAKIIFFVGQIGFLILFAVYMNIENVWVLLVGNYFLFFILFQFMVGVVYLSKPVWVTIGNILRKKGKGWNSLSVKVKKDYLINGLRVVFVIVILGLAWRNWQLTGRVRQLEKVIGESRLFCDQQESIKKVKQSTVRIIGRSSQGSGFFFTCESVPGNKYILTNWHVVAKESHPKVLLPDYTILQGEVIGADKRADLAVVKVDSGKRKISPLKFGTPKDLEEFDELIAVGYPLGTSIKGEATANKGYFSATRWQDGFSAEMVQTDVNVVHGMSGGPMVDVCGKVYGINTMNAQGVSFAISAEEFVEKKWPDMLSDKSPLEDIEKIEIRPNRSPLECVKAFYNYQTTGDFKKAYNLLSREYTTWSFEKWMEGYEDTLFVVFVEARKTEDDPNKIFVKFYSTDLKGETLITRFFEGTQEVKDFNGVYKLVESDIKEIEKPNWKWYYGS